MGGELESFLEEGNIHQKNRGADFDSPMPLCVWRVLEASQGLTMVAGGTCSGVGADEGQH